MSEEKTSVKCDPKCSLRYGAACYAAVLSGGRCAATRVMAKPVAKQTCSSCCGKAGSSN